MCTFISCLLLCILLRCSGCIAKLSFSTWARPWSSLLTDMFWQQEATGVGFTQIFSIYSPICLPYHICLSCTFTEEEEACMQGQMFGRRADLPQHKASRSLWTLPNTAFVNCSEGGALEYIQAVVIWAFSFEKSLPCAFSLFLCSSHAISSQECASAPWAVLEKYLAKNSHSWVKKIRIFSIQLSSLMSFNTGQHWELSLHEGGNCFPQLSQFCQALLK